MTKKWGMNRGYIVVAAGADIEFGVDVVTTMSGIEVVDELEVAEEDEPACMHPHMIRHQHQHVHLHMTQNPYSYSM